MSRSDTIGTHKTHIESDADGIHVRYHATRVISRAIDGTLTLRSGGWRTRTTLLRINQALRQWGTPYYVAQRKFEWLVYNINHSHTTPVAEFSDGMTLGVPS